MHKVIEIITTFNELRDAYLRNLEDNIFNIYFSRILVLTLKTGTIMQDLVTEKLENYILVEFPLNLIKNTFIKNELRVIKYSYLKKHFNMDSLNSSGIESIDKTELVLNLSFLKPESINLLLYKFTGNSFNDYIMITALNNFLNYKIQSEIEETNIINLIKSLQPVQFWTLHNNCNLNITDKFIERDFNIKMINKIKDENIRKILRKMSENIETESYLNFIYRKELYVDASLSLNGKNYILDINKNKKLYETISQDIFNKIIIENRLLNNGNGTITESKEFYFLSMYLMASKDLCHYIINNKEMLELLKNDTNVYKRYIYLFKYLLSYVWISFYLEESVKKRNIDIMDRFIFDIDTANLLPCFPTDNIMNSPYLSFLVAKKVFNIEKNILGVLPDYNEYSDYGVTNIRTFKHRLNYFVSSRNVDYLQDVNWNNIAISGSVIACCLPKCNPLMLNFMSRYEIEVANDRFNEYIDEYYNDSDIDVLCNLHNEEFKLKVYEFYDKIKSNIIKNNDINEISDNEILELKEMASAGIIINTEFVKEYLVSQEIPLSSILLDINDNEIKKMIYPYYVEYKGVSLLTYEQLHIILNNNDINRDKNFIPKSKKEYNEKVLFIVNDSIKYKITSKFLKHGFEIFNIQEKNFFSSVSSFHLPIVRAFYNGSTVLMTPSCITACHTMINIDYKYFAGSRDPIEIINKYRCRGYGIILNDKEKQRFVEYNNLVPKWNQLYSINIKRPETVLNIFGVRQRNDRIYLISEENINRNKLIPIFLNYDIDYFYNNLYGCYNNNYNIIEIVKNFKCINEYGYVNPIQLWIIDAFYNI